MHVFLIVLHLLLLAYWLGADLGVFYASRYVLRPDLSVGQRVVSARIMSALDLSPRICLVLFLPSGVSLMADDPLGRTVFGGWPVAAAWVAAAGWISLVVADYRLGAHGGARLVRRLDLAVRLVVVAVLWSAAIYTLVATQPFGVHSNPKWLGVKVALYATAVASGLGIRYRLREFAPAFSRLVADGSSPTVERALRRAVQGSVPFVAVIWVCVVGAAVFGVAKPWAHLP